MSRVLLISLFYLTVVNFTFDLRFKGNKQCYSLDYLINME
jgi:hypothetical protein